MCMCSYTWTGLQKEVPELNTDRTAFSLLMQPLLSEEKCDLFFFPLAITHKTGLFTAGPKSIAVLCALCCFWADGSSCVVVMLQVWRLGWNRRKMVPESSCFMQKPHWQPAGDSAESSVEEQRQVLFPAFSSLQVIRLQVRQGQCEESTPLCCLAERQNLRLYLHLACKHLRGRCSRRSLGR